MRSPEQRMFLNVITQAIHDSKYKGSNRYFLFYKNDAINWLKSNSYDFRLICRLANVDPDYAHVKFTKFIKNNITTISVQKKPDRNYRPGRYRLTF